MQNFSPENYKGKRIRMTGLLKTSNVNGWAGFWLRVDQPNSSMPLSFDNMKNGKSDRSVKGSTDWTKYDIVLDVPHESSNIAFGALLLGTGQIWFDNIKFEVVDSSVPTTGEDRVVRELNPEPVNLDFQR